MSQLAALKKAVKIQPNLPIWISHLWQRLHVNRLGLILGAGVTVDCGCPSWAELVKRLEKRSPKLKPTIQTLRRSQVHDTYITQILFEAHRKYAAAQVSTLPEKFRPYQVDSTWMQVVYSELYKTLRKKTFDDVSKRHKYLSSLGELVYHAGFTVNFNFDDLVDEAAIRFAEKGRKELPETLWRPKIQTRRGAPVIFHINGCLPREARRRRSDFLTFTEDAFADVLATPGSQGSEFISSRFAHTTFLLLGTSLNDNSLKNLLRESRKRNAANHHYIIYWEDGRAPRSDQDRSYIFDVNLEVYNLISIFLDSRAIKDFIDLLNEQDERAFTKLFNRISQHSPKRCYYLVGSVASGKSSNLEALRCFSTFEEWGGRTPTLMLQDHNSLTPQERVKVNRWLYRQLVAKNMKMKSAGPGIHVMDRGYLDLVAFSKTNKENLTKLSQLRSTGMRSFVNGHILFVKAAGDALSERQAKRGKLSEQDNQIEYDHRRLLEQSDALVEVYNPTSIFDTSNEVCDATAQRIARHILLKDYMPFDFANRVKEIKRKGGRP